VAELVINEFMADNDNVIMDNNGDYSDWIELYNNSTDSIFLGDYYLTDDFIDPTQWQLPAVYLKPGAFKLIWASDNTSGGPWHANFKLSKSGEEIGLFKQSGSNTDTTDFILFGNQNTDESYGRSYDASLQWVTFTTPTPGTSNSPFDINEEKLLNIDIYPNPFTNQLSITNNSEQPIEITLTDVAGRLLEKQTVQAHTEARLIDHGASGIRILQARSVQDFKVIKLIKQ
jgi:hypothetical protein